MPRVPHALPIRARRLPRRLAASFAAALTLLSLLLAAAADAPPTSSAPPLPQAQIAALVRERLEAARIPGAALAITRADGLAYAEGFGEAAPGRPVTAETPFLIGSISKTLTAATVLRLVDAGKIELDAPVRRYLPALALEGPSAEAITVRHLLNHTSGIPKQAGFRDTSDLVDAQHARLDDVQLERAPGQGFAYSNLNYVLLGLVVEAVSGQRFDVVLEGSLLGPLGMKASSARREEAEARGLAVGHHFAFFTAMAGEEPAYGRASVPAGFVAASAEDMGRLLAALMRSSEGEAGAILSREAAAAMRRPWNGEERGYGMGLRAVRWYGEEALVHEGTLGRYSGTIAILPEQGYGVALLTNAGSMTAPTEIVDGVVALLVGKTPEAFRPVEVYGRIGVLAVLLVGIASMVRRAITWQRRGRPRAVDRSRRGLVRLALGLAFAVGVPVGVLIYMGMSPLLVLRLQPDLGWALVIGTLAGIVDAGLRSLIEGAQASAPAQADEAASGA